MSTAVLIVAAGRGTRAGSEIPKQYAVVGEKSVLARTVAAFRGLADIDPVLVVIADGEAARYRSALGDAAGALLPPVTGGATRQASVLAGLEALEPCKPRNVLIHDAARPFVKPETIRSVVAALATGPAAIAALPLADTLKRADGSGRVAGTIERAGLWRAQTPQGFHFAAILAAHREAVRQGLGDFTDDAAVAEWAGLPVTLVPGSAGNTKLTTAEDLSAADERLRHQMSGNLVPRTGTGFDVHRFAEGDHVWLCGVRVPHTHRLEGHSDADAPLHALTDAILGALGDGDIGQHFPPSDPKWKGAPSRLFLEDAARRVRDRGGRIVNVDVTILAEAPRIGPHREAMCDAIASILGIQRSRVGVKATTTEGLGFPGRREGLAALASATVLIPD